MTGETLSYKCLSCGSPLVYDSKGKLKCNSCDSEYDLETLKKYSESENGDSEFDWQDYKKAFEQNKQNIENTAVYICRSCGAEIETNPQTAATHCPYCDNEIILNDRVGSSLKPNGIIPFKVDRNGLENAVKAYFEGKRLLPNKFKNQHKIGKIQGVYVPFWLFDATLDGQMLLEGTETKSYSDSEYDYTEVDHYLVDIDGTMTFKRIPVDASIKMDDDLMDSLEPYNYSDIVDFETAYLSGFLADRFDASPDDSLPRASERMRNSAEEVFINSVNRSFDTITRKSSNMNILNSSVRYVMLPVYLLNVEYKGKNYRFAINGQTGKVVGELPISKIKKRFYFLLTFLISLGIYSGLAWLIYRFMR
ncbi:MAG: hypothetical protein IK057_02055 [Clostridia bacterium]|nr:hypothetical protein [Clostridia bacterium]